MQRREFLQFSALCALVWSAPASAQTRPRLPIKLDQRASEVLKILGKPTSQNKAVFEQATALTVQDWRYPSLGIQVKMASDEPKGKQKVVAITISGPCKFTTDKGIGLGDRADQVKSAYSGKIDKETSNAETIVVGSVYDGIIFQIEKGKVTRIFWGAAAE